MGLDWLLGSRSCAASPALILIGRAEERRSYTRHPDAIDENIVLPIAVHGLQLHMTGDPQQDVITIEYNGFLVESDLVRQDRG